MVVFQGMCDASGAIPLAGNSVAVVDDETNVMRVYDGAKGGAPLRALDLTDALAVDRGRREKVREADLEGGARVAELAFWIGSHGQGKKGKPRPERRVLFATSVDALELKGGVYRTLVEDLARDERYARFGLAEAAEQPPEEADGLNIEGIAERREGGVWIGFRNPRPQGRALLAALENPAAVIRGEPARFGEPALLDLGGRGIRDVTRVQDHYVMFAAADSQARSGQLYRWDGMGAPVALAHDVAWLTGEGIVLGRDGTILLLSDDGDEITDGTECKRAPPAARSFRGVWLNAK